MNHSKENRKCRECGNRLKKAYLVTRETQVKVGWVCPNFPNKEWNIHYQTDDEFDWWKIARKHEITQSQSGKSHNDLDEEISCVGSVQRLCVENEGDWKPIGWFCVRCNQMIFDEKWKKELEEKEKNKLRDFGAIVS